MNVEEKIYTQDEIQEFVEDIRSLVSDLGWDYERFTRGGKDVYNELCNKLGID